MALWGFSWCRDTRLSLALNLESNLQSLSEFNIHIENKVNASLKPRIAASATHLYLVFGTYHVALIPWRCCTKGR
jgi:hypothetical protein